ncbi:MAG: acetolactate synthase large subunit [Gammaproteobacteria bacterium]|nr:acetolactate synthase large subunit [Pseudomonadota bacterium]MCH9663738.1 acetolactate synthase large subunit [Gammaproteobacteria bacterium]
MNGAQLLVKCLENEGIEYIFGIPGEENIDVMDALLDSNIRFITTRHEQGAAFMANVYGRLTGKASVCLATLGPGATNLLTGYADADMDYAPIIAVCGQGATTRRHKESHQMLDLVSLFRPVSKYVCAISEPETIPEVVRKAVKIACAQKPGGSFIELPENIADMPVPELTPAVRPLKVQSPAWPEAGEHKLSQVAKLIDNARYPIILAGNGLIRAGACAALVEFSEKLNIPVATTFMAKGAIPFSHANCLGTVGLQARDYIACGIERSDLILCIGYDIIEYPPRLWNIGADKKIIHIDLNAAEVDSSYELEAGVIGDVSYSLAQLQNLAKPERDIWHSNLRQTIAAEHLEGGSGFPIKPQQILLDVREALDDDDILISDVGAHKMWIARLYQAQSPNSCIISNGFASMGIGVPGAIAAKLVHPQRKVLTINGDAGFLMNSQEIETAVRLGLAFVILIWTDSQYGLIRWHQLRKFGRSSHIDFNNPDFVTYAESFGARGYRISEENQLLPVLHEALNCGTVAVIDCPVDYSENMKLTKKLGELVCPL